jgi:hypothetical protein
MVLFSRSFVRKRLISLAATASVAATSFALAEDPTPTDQARGAMPIRHVAMQADHSQEHPSLPENGSGMSRMMTDMTVKWTGDTACDSVLKIVPMVSMRKAASVGLSSAAQPPEQRCPQVAPQSARIDDSVVRGERRCLNGRPSGPLSQAALQG